MLGSMHYLYRKEKLKLPVAENLSLELPSDKRVVERSVNSVINPISR